MVEGDGVSVERRTMADDDRPLLDQLAAPFAVDREGRHAGVDLPHRDRHFDPCYNDRDARDDAKIIEVAMSDLFDERASRAHARLISTVRHRSPPCHQVSAGVTVMRGTGWAP